VSQTVELLRGDKIAVTPVAWLWHGWIAGGKLHVLAGEPGAGKTTIGLALAATLTVGGQWPDGTQAPVGDVLIWSGEDGPADTLAPRLMAAGADMRRVHFVKRTIDGGGSRPFCPATDMPALDKAVRGVPEPRLLILDPIVNAISGDSHKNSEVRRALAPVVEFAEAHRMAVMGITHFSKHSGGRSPVERLNGSLAFGALARLVLVVTKGRAEDDGRENRRLLVRAKSNLGPDEDGFLYSLEQAETDGGISAARVVWGGEISGSARDLLADAEKGGGGGLREAKEWLRELLAKGPVEQQEVKRKAEVNGFSWATVRRAKSLSVNR